MKIGYLSNAEIWWGSCRSWTTICQQPQFDQSRSWYLSCVVETGVLAINSGCAVGIAAWNRSIWIDCKFQFFLLYKCKVKIVPRRRTYTSRDTDDFTLNQVVQGTFTTLISLALGPPIISIWPISFKEMVVISFEIFRDKDCNSKRLKSAYTQSQLHDWNNHGRMRRESKEKRESKNRNSWDIIEWYRTGYIKFPCFKLIIQRPPLRGKI